MPDFDVPPAVSLANLREFDVEAARRFPLPDSYLPGLGALGLIMDRNFDGSRCDWCTPTNCRTFACTGGNGVHFSLLVRDGRVDGQCSVVITNPGGGDGRSWIVGENLFDFLCLGTNRGYFALEQLAYSPELTLRVYTDKAWQPSEDWHESVGFVPDGFQRRVLEFLSERFGLRPWPGPERFEELQEGFGSQLELPLDLIVMFPAFSMRLERDFVLPRRLYLNRRDTPHSPRRFRKRRFPTTPPCHRG